MFPRLFLSLLRVGQDALTSPGLLAGKSITADLPVCGNLQCKEMNKAQYVGTQCYCARVFRQSPCRYTLIYVALS